MASRATRLFVWTMILLLPASAMASDSVGLMTATGPVYLQRAPARAGSNAIFEGDRIDTKAQSRAFVTRRGTAITVLENSSVTLGSQALSLETGSVVVSAEQGIVTNVNNATITVPAGASGKFLARMSGGELRVLVLEGNVLVSDGTQEKPVPATTGVKLPSPRSSGQAGDPAKGMSWLTNPEIGILIVVAAAITAGVTLGIVNAHNAKSVSPSAP
jgi:hypothetical protein